MKQHFKKYYYNCCILLIAKDISKFKTGNISMDVTVNLGLHVCQTIEHLTFRHINSILYTHCFLSRNHPFFFLWKSHGVSV